jgi:GNAT superfamily N-acetyltransferase
VSAAAGRRPHSTTAVIERVGDLPPERLADLLADSEHAGSRIVRRLADEWMSGVNRFDRPGEALFAARMDPTIVAVCGLNIDPYAAKPGVGRVRHLYVMSAYRRFGLGGLMVRETIGAARGRFDSLHLRTNNPEAARLYERLGFRPRADVACCTHVMDMRGTAVRPDHFEYPEPRDE